MNPEVKKMLKNNYHTHTTRCHHAKDDDRLYIEEAIRAHMKTLGFSDHIPFKYNATPTRIRMSYVERLEYFETLRKLKEEYQDRIDIKIGFEAEFIDKEIPFYKELLDNHQVDYLILGNHSYNGYAYNSSSISSPEEIELYTNRLIRAMQSGLYKYVAHPDIFMAGYKEFDHHCLEATKKICEEALKLDLPLEYNAEGLRDTLSGRIWKNGTTIGYPHPEFWKVVKQYNNRVIIGADAHTSSALNDLAIEEAQKQVKELGLNLIDEISFK